MSFNIVVLAKQVGEQEGTRDTKRYGEDNRQRHEIALILGTQYQVHEGQAKTEDDNRGVARLLL